MVREYPDEDQRRAVCEKQWEEGESDMRNKSFKSPFKRGKPGYEIQNGADGVTEMYIYDEIGWLGVEAEVFVQDLKRLKGEVLVRINSPGGSVWDGMAIYNAIRERKEPTNTIVDGLAASAASYIAVAGHKISIAENAFLMIHEPWSGVIGPASEMRKEADLLDKVNEQIINMYVKKSGKAFDEIQAAMADETWLNGKDAVEWGLADEVTEEQPVENLFDLSVFNNVPESLTARSFSGDSPARKDIEQALRQAGLSRAQATAFYAKGKAVLADEEVSDDEWAAIQRLTRKIKGQ